MNDIYILFIQHSIGEIFIFIFVYLFLGLLASNRNPLLLENADDLLGVYMYRRFDCLCVWGGGSRRKRDREWSGIHTMLKAFEFNVYLFQICLSIFTALK